MCGREYKMIMFRMYILGVQREQQNWRGGRVKSDA